MKLHLTLIFAFVTGIFAQSPLYENKYFSLYSDKVVEGEKIASVLSPHKISTNYVEALADGFDRLVKFKFAINGKDNERVSGVDHEVYLNPRNGYYETPLFVFGEPDPVGSGLPQGREYSIKPNEAFEVKFRVDLGKVLSELETNGYFLFFNGDTLFRHEFDGLYIAGGAAPLTWDFDLLPSRNDLKLSDTDGDGIYEITLKFLPASYRKVSGDTGFWELNKDISRFPQLKSSVPVVEAMYNLSLEELLENIRPDGAFMAGAKWNGVWTRDISYSIVLSLASIMPDASKVSLMAKVKDGMIIQDTGTGGSYPVSSDRMTWVLAAWEIYKSTGELEWLQTIYPIIKKSVEQDLQTLYNEEDFLASGESSFLDWREQSYPEWMDPKDIFISKNLGTNIVHYATLEILYKAGEILGQKSDKYSKVAARLKNEINVHMWLEEKGYYGQYLYGRNYLTLSPKSETLGEALAVLYDVADQNMAKSIIENTPSTFYGTTCFYPQIPGIPPYHNNGIWPFVQAYQTWAAARVKNEEAVLHGIASIFRPAMLFLTNKENFVAETGDFNGTQINSNRQLWSVAGNIAMVYRVLFGIEVSEDGLSLAPFVPKSIGGEYQLTNFKYHNASLNIKISGYGSAPKAITVNGIEKEDLVISPDAEGLYEIVIEMNGEKSESQYTVVENNFAPETPVVKRSGDQLAWEPVESASYYNIYINGKHVNKQYSTEFTPAIRDYLSEIQVNATDENGFESFLSEPVTVQNKSKVQTVSTDNILITKERNTNLTFEFSVPESGKYSIDFYYGNGTGPINTDNNCAIRTVIVAGVPKTLVLPQRGTGNHNGRGYSNPVQFELQSGKQTLVIKYSEVNRNMDGEINEAVLDHFRITRIE